jgi:FkbM family methyltransferase
MPAETQSSLPAQRFVSYAQNYEDVMLWRALQHVEQGFYIDVGAQSAESDSVTQAFSLRGWRGINIEPHPVYFEQLVRLRPNDVNLDVALGEESGTLTMNLIDESGLSTADAEIAGRHVAAGYTLRAHEVRMLTLAEVWQGHVPDGQSVHFLKVDVEGFERSVLAGNDWQRYRPWIVLVEATLPNSQIENHDAWEPILAGAGYKYVYADGLNRFYVAEEHVELAPAFKYPPNVFDGFITAPFERMQREYSQLTLDLDAVHVRASNLLQQVGALERGLQDGNERASSLQQQVGALERSLQECHRRIECAETALVQTREREMALQDRLDAERTALGHEIEQRHQLLERAEHRVNDAEQRRITVEQQRDAAEHQRDAAEHQRDAVIQSPWWRITAPGRALLGVAPKSLRRLVRRSAKAAWWVATPWRIPARLRFIRERQRTGMQAAAVVEPPTLNLYPDRTPGLPPMPPIEALPQDITDRPLAARWCMCLLRSQPEVRARFPQALSQPEADGFLAWVRNEGGERFGLSESERSLVVSVLQENFGHRARQYYFDRADVRRVHPHGLSPDGQEDLYRWFVQFGCSEGHLSPEEVLWLFIQVSEATNQRRADYA